MPGRVKGSVNQTTREAREFATLIIDDPKYRANLKERALSGTLHPSVENTILHYRFGKPKETIDIVNPGDSVQDLDDMDPMELAAEAELLARHIRDEAAREENEATIVSERSANRDVHLFGIGSPSKEEVH